MSRQVLRFGPYKLWDEQIFLIKEHIFGLVNLKPVAPGHVMLIPH